MPKSSPRTHPTHSLSHPTLPLTHPSTQTQTLISHPPSLSSRKRKNSTSRIGSSVMRMPTTWKRNGAWSRVLHRFLCGCMVCLSCWVGMRRCMSCLIRSTSCCWFCWRLLRESAPFSRRVFEKLNTAYFCRYIVLQLGLAGPMLQVSRTVFNEVRQRTYKPLIPCSCLLEHLGETGPHDRNRQTPRCIQRCPTSARKAIYQQCSGEQRWSCTIRTGTRSEVGKLE